MAGQPVTWSGGQPLLLDRKGFFEETYFTTAYCPVPDETTASGFGGVLSIVTETTEQVFVERQIKTRREIATRVAGSQRRWKHAGIGSR